MRKRQPLVQAYLSVWRDSSGRISAIRIVTLACLLVPLGKILYDSDSIRLDPRPITNLIHRTGDWSLIFLLLALRATFAEQMATLSITANIVGRGFISISITCPNALEL
jgi:sulfoxide reductase heme-binding subunit YedZ